MAGILKGGPYGLQPAYWRRKGMPNTCEYKGGEDRPGVLSR